MVFSLLLLRCNTALLWAMLMKNLMLDDNVNDNVGFSNGVVLEGSVYSPRQAIFFEFARGMATLAEAFPLLTWRCCYCCCRLTVIVDATVVIRCICGVTLSFAHAGVFVGAYRSSQPDNHREPLTRCCSNQFSFRRRKSIPSLTLGSLLYFAGKHGFEVVVMTFNSHPPL